jgi:hypothetical protein
MKRKRRDCEMTVEEMREYMARIEREKAEREAEREKARIKAILAVWED